MNAGATTSRLRHVNAATPMRCDKVRLKKAPQIEMRCERIPFEQVPKPPSRKRDGVIDVGRERWRFDKVEKLTVYILYEDDPVPKWEKLWTRET